MLDIRTSYIAFLVRSYRAGCLAAGTTTRARVHNEQSRRLFRRGADQAWMQRLYSTLLYPTQPYLTLPYSTSPYPILPYPTNRTLPCPTYPTAPTLLYSTLPYLPHHAFTAEPYGSTLTPSTSATPICGVPLYR